uniref:NADH-ubiquinone oxidoreductase chain 4L n=1 Tax=Hypsicera sp. ZJUH_2016019 TaxID=2491161 RepID=A0A3Q8U9V0_9HYME|nr:NADH dehydrogenase subunit 4L [Hypsicera sp. ZJUH_2016019]
MNNFNYLLTLYMYMISIFILIYYKSHMLLMIISLEFIMMSVFFNMFVIYDYLEIKLNNLIIFMSLVVCEGGLGLSLVVLMVRIYGNDYLNSLSITKW